VLVDGEIGIGDGWFLNLDEPYFAAEDDDGNISFSQELRMILPQTISWDPTSTTLTSEQILMDQIDTLGTELTDLGPISGKGWVGRLFREPIDPESGEHQLIAPLAAESTLLNLAVRFIGPDEEDGARRVIEAVVHEPEARDAMNAQLRKQMGIE
jgi:hypothetical protein